MQHDQGRNTSLAFLDCSKCYERAGHNVAGSRALLAGLPGRIANSVFFDMHGADRHIKAQGAVAPPRCGNRGLVAGCAFAKDILQAFLAEPLRQCPTGQPRDSVDDITYPTYL